MSDAAQQSSLAAEAYSVVRQRILSGTIGLGQVISRRKLAAELRMSFLPVSEALLRLEVEGLLESRPRAGTRVRIPSAEDVQGHYVVREALEVQAALRFASFATPRERSELKKLAGRVDVLGMQSDRMLYQSVHLKLHSRIAQNARCPALLEAIEKTHALASIWYCMLRQPSPTDPTTRHAELAEALCDGSAHRGRRRGAPASGGGHGTVDRSAPAVLQAPEAHRHYLLPERSPARNSRSHTRSPAASIRGG